MKPELKELLAALPKGSHVAIVHMLGTLCPITTAHIQMFEAAKSVLENKYTVVGGLFLNNSSFVDRKMRKKKLQSLTYETRVDLAKLATASIPWIEVNLNIDNLQDEWPELHFAVFDMNGADDVLKYQKWTYNTAMIVIGRPGFTEKVREGVKRDKEYVSKNFIIGPELEDVSSTLVREWIQHSQWDRAAQVLHPAVLKWHQDTGFNYIP
eukprot:m.16693 g.16693  ORF g.16693 m.16693 type:complete len:210 (-) comp5769_c0_seq1:422-1051(-)